MQVGESEVPGPLFADDLMRMFATPDGLQIQIDSAVEIARKWKFPSSVKKCAAVVFNDSKGENGGDEELLRMDQ